jgi:integrase
MRLNFTKATLERLLSTDDGRRKMIHDAKQPALAADICGGRLLTFYLYKWHNGRPLKYRIGRWPEITIDQARQESVKLLGRMASGEDIAVERRQSRVEHTFGALFEHWLEIHAKPRLRSWPEELRRFNQHFTQWKQRRLSSISRAEVQALHLKLGRECGHVTANRALSLIKKLFNKADSIGYSGDNQGVKVKPFDEQSRDRFLQPDEMPRFLAALQQEPQLFQDFFLIALLTGARRRNVEAMRWEDVQLEAAVWRIPQTKSGEPVLIHLPEKAVEILRRRHIENGRSEWVFPTRSKSGHLVEPKEPWARILTHAGLENLRIHDLRRTLGSWQAIAGTSLPIIGKSLGHKSLTATAIYSRLTMAPVAESVDQATDAMLAAAQPKRKSRTRTRSGNGKA